MIVDWSKLKTAAKFKRAQRRSFDRRRPYAAPNLINKVIAMSAPLLHCAPPQHRHRLFVVKRLSSGARHGDGIGLIDVGRCVAPFGASAGAPTRASKRGTRHIPIDRRDQRCPTLPRYSSVAASRPSITRRGDILVAQAVLNHADAVTTETYIKGPETRRLQHETIARCARP